MWPIETRIYLFRLSPNECSYEWFQISMNAPAAPVIEGRELTSSALDSFRELNQSLENHPSNLALKQAIQNLLKRRGESI